MKECHQSYLITIFFSKTASVQDNSALGCGVQQLSGAGRDGGALRHTMSINHHLLADTSVTRVEHSHWSANVEIVLSLVESLIELKYFHDVATLSYAIKNQLVASKTHY